MEKEYELPKGELVIVGTSHIAKTSVQRVKSEFLRLQPDIVCVELDKNRLQTLLSKDKNRRIPISAIKQIGATGYLFALMAGFVQKKLGNAVGVMPGSDMLQAVKLAKINNIPLGLIDQDITITLRRLNKYFTFKEKTRIFSDVFLGVFSKKYRQNLGIDFDISKVPEDELIDKMVGYVKTRYPNLHKVLIHERNIIMAKRIRLIQEKEPHKKLLVVVGAGHKREMIDILKN